MSQTKSKAGAFDEYQPFVGKHTVERYTGTKRAPCVIGSDRFSYADLARRAEMPAGRAARIITKIAEDHGAKSLAHLYQVSSPMTVAVAGFGSSSLLLLFRLFDSAGKDSAAWASRGWHDKKATTFDSFKRRGLKRSRKGARRGQ